MTWWMVVLGYLVIGFIVSAMVSRVMYEDSADTFLWFCFWPIMLVVTLLYVLWKIIAGEW